MLFPRVNYTLVHGLKELYQNLCASSFPNAYCACQTGKGLPCNSRNGSPLLFGKLDALLPTKSLKPTIDSGLVNGNGLSYPLLDPLGAYCSSK